MPGDRPTPWPLISVAIEPRSRVDLQKLAAALAALAAKDPSIRVSTDSESGQTVIRAANERLLDAKLDLLRRTYGIGVNISAVQVAYRERLTRHVEMRHEPETPTGEPGDRVSIRLEVGPNEPGKGNQLESRIPLGRLDEAYVQAIGQGVEVALETGVLGGFPLDEVKVVLVDATWHSAAPPARAFDVVARAAMREAMAKAEPVLVEPVMRLAVTVPEDLAGAVIGDLVGRAARIRGRERRGDAVVIGAEAWLSSMLGYGKALQAMSDGRATLTMDFDRFAPSSAPEHDPPFGPAMAMRA
jgi:elongation factor G